MVACCQKKCQQIIRMAMAQNRTQDGRSASTFGFIDDVRGHLGQLLWPSWAMSGPSHLGVVLGGLGGYLGPPWGLRIKTKTTDTLFKDAMEHRQRSVYIKPIVLMMKNELDQPTLNLAYFVEMPKSLSRYACAVEGAFVQKQKRHKIVPWQL